MTSFSGFSTAKWGLVIMTVGIAAAAETPRAAGQTRSAPSSAPPYGILMLPGYTHAKTGAGEAVSGEIVKAGGPKIRYEIGMFVTDVDRVLGGVKWVKEQTIDGRKVRVALANNGWILVGDGAGLWKFVGENVKDPEDATDFFLTALSFDPARYMRNVEKDIQRLKEEAARKKPKPKPNPK